MKGWRTLRDKGKWRSIGQGLILLMVAIAALTAQEPVPSQPGAAGLPGPAVASGLIGASAPSGELRRGRELLTKGQFAEAKQVFATYLRAHPETDSPARIQAELGLGDAQLGLHQYETAEATYRTVTMQQPEMWQAHKNLVVVEAALGRWEEFDRERAVLRMARERGAPGISERESDVIDSFTVGAGHWVVRAYYEPVGRSEARYNFERFSPEGRVQAYVSLENATAARSALTPEDLRIGAKGQGASANSETVPLALNWYTGTSHGTVRSYATGEPSYERLRAEVLRWLRAHPEASDVGQGTSGGRRSSVTR